MKTTEVSDMPFIALAVGWLVYMIAMMLTVYDGIPSLIFQPFIAMFCSWLTVVFSLLVGLPLQIPLLRSWWYATLIPAGALATTCLGILCFGSTLGLTITVVVPETQEAFSVLRPDAGFAGYFGLIFAITHWPMKRKTEMYRSGKNVDQQSILR